MALSAAQVWEVRTTGSDSNGGAFKAGATGTDYSQQDAAQFSGTDLAVDATLNTKVTSASHNFVAADVGNVIQITAGAGWTVGFYEIVSVAANAATLDRSPAATSTTGGTWAEGGALATPGKAGSGHVGGNTIWVKGGPYTVSSASANVAGGCVSLATSFSATSYTTISGYTATRGDGGQASRASSTGFSDGGNTGRLTNCKAINCTTGFSISNADVVQCWADVCGTGFNMTSNGWLFGCVAKSCTTAGFQVQSGNADTCLAYLCAIGFSASGPFGTIRFLRCTAANNTSHGFSINAGQFHGKEITNCVIYGNGGWGITVTSGGQVYVTNCAFGANTSGATSLGTGSVSSGTVTLTADPFVNAAGGNFALNSTAGGGAACRAAGTPGVFPAGLTTSYTDIGAVQHQDSGAGGGLLLPYGGLGGGLG
jgi:hypothetical protein